jgi:hypothetical protein
MSCSYTLFRWHLRWLWMCLSLAWYYVERLVDIDYTWKVSLVMNERNENVIRARLQGRNAVLVPCSLAQFKIEDRQSNLLSSRAHCMECRIIWSWLILRHENPMGCLCCRLSTKHPRVVAHIKETESEKSRLMQSPQWDDSQEGLRPKEYVTVAQQHVLCGAQPCSRHPLQRRARLT